MAAKKTAKKAAKPAKQATSVKKPAPAAKPVAKSTAAAKKAAPAKKTQTAKKAAPASKTASVKKAAPAKKDSTVKKAATRQSAQAKQKAAPTKKPAAGSKAAPTKQAPGKDKATKPSAEKVVKRVIPATDVQVESSKKTGKKGTTTAGDRKTKDVSSPPATPNSVGQAPVTERKNTATPTPPANTPEQSKEKPPGKVVIATKNAALKPATEPKRTFKVVPYEVDEATGRPIVPPGYKPSPDEEYMNPLMLEYFRQRLLQWRAELVEESKQTIENLREEVRDIGDEAERATRETENSLELRTRDRYRKLIAKIDSTLKRIDSGDYGYCVDTGEEIGLERMEARLTAERTVDAQERWEHQQKMMGE